MTAAVVMARPPATDLLLHRRLRWGVGAAALVLYTLTCCPTVHWGDSGELIFAGIALGIAHPPGHPLYSMVAHLFSWLPVGTPAWRINWMSAVFGAVAVVLVFELAADTVRRLGAPTRRATLCAVFAAGMFAVTSGMWDGSTVAETTTLHAAFMAGLMWLVWRIAWVRPSGPVLTHALGAAAVLYGFSATNHVAGLFFLPAFAALLIGRCGREVLHPRNVATMCACVFAGLSLYAYLYLRSQQDPPLDWGNPETVQNLWWVMSAKQYQEMMPPQSSLAGTAQALALRGRTVVHELTGVGTVLALGGVLRLGRTAPGLGLFILMACLPLVALGLSTAFILAYFVPALLLLVVGLAVASAALSARLSRVPLVLGSCGAAALIGWSGLSHAASGARQDDRSAEMYAQAIFDLLPQQAVLVSTNNNMHMTMWGLQASQRVREDVALIFGHWAADDTPMTQMMQERYPTLHFPDHAETVAYQHRFDAPVLTHDIYVAAFAADNLGVRPLYLGMPDDAFPLREHLVVHGPIAEYRPAAGTTMDAEAIGRTQLFWDEWTTRLEANAALQATTLTPALTEDLRMQGMFWERIGRPDLARWAYDRAIRLEPEEARPYLLRGLLTAREGDWPGAALDFRQAVALAPDSAVPHYHVGMAEEALGNWEAAYRAYLEALIWDPNHGDTLRRAGILMLRSEDYARGRAYLERALQANSADGAAARALAELALAHGDLPGAAAAIERARRIEPVHVVLYLLMAEYAARSGQEHATTALAEAFALDPEFARAATADASWASGLLPQLDVD